MGCRALCATAVLACAGAAAAVPADPAWRVAGIAGDPFAPDVTVYFDATRLAAGPDGLAVRSLWSYASPQGASGYRAMRADVRVRCADDDSATVHASFHADVDGRGPEVDSYSAETLAWTAVQPRTLGAGLIRAACAEARRRGLA
jgi:hypothetical protein